MFVKKMSDSMLDREASQAEKDKLADNHRTERSKSVFITELKTGLGNSIKRNPGKWRKIKKPFVTRVIDFIKKIFTNK
jgi:hypothetical protein